MAEADACGDDLDVRRLICQSDVAEFFPEFWYACEQKNPPLAVKIGAYLHSYNTIGVTFDYSTHARIMSLRRIRGIITGPSDVRESYMRELASGSWDSVQCMVLCHFYRHYPEHLDETLEALEAAVEEESIKFGGGGRNFTNFKHFIAGSPPERAKLLFGQNTQTNPLFTLPPKLIAEAWATTGHRLTSLLPRDPLAVCHIIQGLSIPAAARELGKLPKANIQGIFDTIAAPKWMAEILIEPGANSELAKAACACHNATALLERVAAVKESAPGKLAEIFPHDRDKAPGPYENLPMGNLLVCMFDMPPHEAAELLKSDKDAARKFIRMLRELVRKPSLNRFCQIFWRLVLNSDDGYITEFSELVWSSSKGFTRDESLSKGGKSIFQLLVERGCVSDRDLAEYLRKNKSKLPFDVDSFLTLLPTERADHIRQSMKNGESS
jgi:hypothetical protein